MRKCEYLTTFSSFSESYKRLKLRTLYTAYQIYQKVTHIAVFNHIISYHIISYRIVALKRQNRLKVGTNKPKLKVKIYINT